MPFQRDPDLVAASDLVQRAKGLWKASKRDELLRQAAEDYRVAFELGRALDRAPQPAFEGAYTYKQLGDYAEAIAIYQLFIAEYGKRPSGP